MTHLTLASVLALSLCLLQVEAGNDYCRIRGSGKMVSFSKSKLNIRLPCKFEAMNLGCDGYTIKVTPGQALDSKFRYYVETARIVIRKPETGFFWVGRTNSIHVNRYFQNTSSRTPFLTVESSGSENVRQTEDDTKAKVTVSMNDATFQINFYANDEKHPKRRTNAGVEVICPNASFSDNSVFPNSFCGVEKDVRSLPDRKKALGFVSRTDTIMYEMLDDATVVHTNPKCDTASMVFRTCPADRTEVIKGCQKLISNNNMLGCMLRKNFDPMNTFIYCLKYKCTNDAVSCDLLKEVIEQCSDIPAFTAGTVCPSSGGP